MSANTSEALRGERREQRDVYETLARGEHGDGPRGSILFVVSTDDLDQGRGDLYVALGLAKYLQRSGWGVRLLPMSRWGDPVPDGTTVVVSMLESWVAGLVPQDIPVVAWVRNWTDTWRASPQLVHFDAVWSSSERSASALSEAGAERVAVLPIGVDDELFFGTSSEKTIDVFSSTNLWNADRSIGASLARLAADREVVWAGNGATPDSRITALGPLSYFALPDLYDRSRLVVDDLIAPARAFGNHNSRLFESIAAGALPVTNERRGLAELGLEKVPTYDTADELAGVVDTLLADNPAAMALQAELAAVVAARHTFRHRAATAAGLLEDVIADHPAFQERPDWMTALANERNRLIAAEVEREMLRAAVIERDGHIAALQERLSRILSMTSVRAAMRLQRTVRRVQHR